MCSFILVILDMPVTITNALDHHRSANRPVAQAYAMDD